MGEHKTITEFYEKDYDELDALFKTVQTLKRSDFAKAKEAFEAFKFGLQRHIVREEDLLFPLWEKKTGRSEEGPTVVMRVEHRQIKQQLEAIHGKVAEQNPDSDKEEQALLDISVLTIGKKSGPFILPSTRWPVRTIAKPSFRI